MPRLGLTGDVMLGRLVDDNRRRRAADAVWGNVLDRLRALDGLAINLECTLSTRGRQWTRTHRPFHFRANPDWAIPALEAAGVDFAALANNHVLDFQEPALKDTVDHLGEAGVAYAGAGRTLADAREPALFSVGDLDVAVVAATDNTPEYAAGPDQPGVVRLELDADDTETREAFEEMLGDARALDPDLVMASLHWGPNMVAIPDEQYREFGRWLAERVDLIHGHSAHVVQGIEVRDGTPILYDCGDFVDDYRVDEDLRNDRSFLFVADVDATGVRELRLHPVEIYDFAVHEARGEVAAWLRRAMRERTEPFETTYEREGEALVCRVR